MFNDKIRKFTTEDGEILNTGDTVKAVFPNGAIHYGKMATMGSPMGPIPALETFKGQFIAPENLSMAQLTYLIDMK